MSKFLHTAAALGALFAVGCNPADEARDAGAAGRSFGQIQMVFTRDGAERAELQGQFVRYRAPESARAALIGLSDDESIPLDRCRAVDGAEEIDRALASGPGDVVELLDAGRLSVRGAGGATLLEPRHFPELTPYVAGVVYGGDGGKTVPLEPGAVYEVTGEGGEEVGPFSALVQAPRAFPQVESPAWRRGADLELKWGAAGEVSEPLVVQVEWSGRAGTRALKCRVRDDGGFPVPRDLLPGPGDAISRAELTVTRSRRGALFAPGVGHGELSVGLREVLPLAVGE